MPSVTCLFSFQERVNKKARLCLVPLIGQSPGFVDEATRARQGNHSQHVVEQDQIQVSVAPQSVGLAAHFTALPVIDILKQFHVK